jgi:hypothetical protein
MEFSVALADIGNPSPGSSIRIMATISNGDHSYLSNQFLSSLAPPQGNLGGDGMGGFDGNLDGINMNNFAGNQFFTLTVPGTPGQPGDHNGDGIVDAADYVFWRKFDAANQGGYDDWFENFGEGSAGAGGGGGVPEPGSFALAAIGGLLALVCNRRK